MPLLEKGKKNAWLRFWFAVAASIWMVSIYYEARFSTSPSTRDEAYRIFELLFGASLLLMATRYWKEKDYFLVGIALIAGMGTIFASL